MPNFNSNLHLFKHIYMLTGDIVWISSLMSFIPRVVSVPTGLCVTDEEGRPFSRLRRLEPSLAHWLAHPRTSYWTRPHLPCMNQGPVDDSKQQIKRITVLIFSAFWKLKSNIESKNNHTLHTSPKRWIQD